MNFLTHFYLTDNSNNVNASIGSSLYNISFNLGCLFGPIVGIQHILFDQFHSKILVIIFT